jgi:hypothetical protein
MFDFIGLLNLITKLKCTFRDNFTHDEMLCLFPPNCVYR